MLEISIYISILLPVYIVEKYLSGVFKESLFVKNGVFKNTVTIPWHILIDLKRIYSLWRFSVTK